MFNLCWIYSYFILNNFSSQLGIYNMGNYEKIDITPKDAYMDGIKWRHISCPLIINNDSTRCTKCVTLSHMSLLHKS